MLVQIFASSACTGVVVTIGAPSDSNSRAARSDYASPTPPTTHGSVPIGHEAVGGDPLRHVGHEDLLAHTEAAQLLQVAGHELGRPGGDRGAQHEQLPRRQDRQQVVEHRADVAEVDLDGTARGCRG
jgi:hypothetical protein